jgi:hypothetical protein
MVRPALPRSFVVACLAAPLLACSGGHSRSGSSAAAVEQGSSNDFDLEIEFGSYAFLGSTMAGGQTVGVIPAGAHLGINYVKNYSDVGLAAAPTALEVDWAVNGTTASQSVSNEFSATDGRIGFDTAIDVPATATGQLAIWFKFTDADGSVGYDSRNGQNYIANLLPSSTPTIQFAAPQGGTWPAPTVQGSLTAGGSFRVQYDFGRVTALGFNATDAAVEAYANSLDANGAQLGVSNGNVESGQLSNALSISAGAAQVQVYFEIVSDGQSTYDSNLGQNFSFSVN